MTLANAALSTHADVLKLLPKWNEQNAPDERALFTDFVTHCLERLRGPFLAQHQASEILQHLSLSFRYVKQRKAGEVLVSLSPSEGRGILVLCNMDDQPFVVDTIRLFLKQNKSEYWGGFTLTFKGDRDESGKLKAILPDSSSRETLVLMEANGTVFSDNLEKATQALAQNLATARAIVDDFRPMIRSVERYIEKLEVTADRSPEFANQLRETSSFLKWILAENFIFFGVDAAEPLGIQRLDFANSSKDTGSWPPPHMPQTVHVRKSTQESTVHRAGRIDELLIIPPPDCPIEQHLYIRGMFTYRAVTQACRNIPILSGVLAGILNERAHRPGSFRYKGIANGFDSLPTEFLFTVSRKAIAETLDLVFESEQQQEVGVTFLKTGPHSAFCLIAMPKAQFSDELRNEMEAAVVNNLEATYVDHGVFVGRYDTVLLHFYLTGVKESSREHLQTVSELLRNLATPWTSQLWHHLNEEHGAHKADELLELYGDGFPHTFTRTNPVIRAVRDVDIIDTLTREHRLAADVYVDHDNLLTLRLYEGKDVYLTDILPILDNFGITVVECYATTVITPKQRVYLDTFTIQPTKSLSLEAVLDRATLLRNAVEACFEGQVTSDGFNELVLSTGLTWREVDLIRSYVAYSRQLQTGLSVARTISILVGAPQLTKQLVSLFHARFSPSFSNRDTRIESLSLEINDAIRRIQTHDEDLLFSSLSTLINATVRTNFYRDDMVFHYISFKVDCSKIDFMDGPRPLYEIFVFHKEVEGVHIRFGPVARGGLRWSDRDDYRTEVMGLATTQVVKNVVIVPVGSKGGYLLHNPSRDFTQRRAQGDLHYKTFIRGMLDITDTVVDKKTVHPPRVICHDGDDPYLVVAADKGTAHLSDTANALSLSYGYWLGDAFASGGSNGYDHKVEGITARGAWVLVKRHFAEMGKDPYAEEFTCAGVGDMGGDVFGNGLIESSKTQLVAAFNHLHIFLDPSPNAATSYEERKRLFACGREGGWNNYNPQLISTGGGVYSRFDKLIPLSPEAQRLLGIDSDHAQPERVIRHILKMPVDLLWNGGIGTYVKSPQESDSDADDRSNDGVRIDSNELRCKVIGEGGNLGMTQKARIEAGLAGVALNTDFIDNSAGVDMSDHEVNLKILLNSLVAQGKLNETERNDVLRQMTDEVSELVLLDNDAQGRQLSRDVVRSKQNIFQFGRAIDFVAKHFNLSAESLGLPSRDELKRRAELSAGLTRPELAVLSSRIKMFVFDELVAGDPKRLPGYHTLLHTYFPTLIQKRWPNEIREHLLANEIAMTQATTRILADSGVCFIPLALERTSASISDIAEAYLKAQHLARTSEVRAALEECRATVELADRTTCWIQVDEGVRAVALTWLSSRGQIPSEEQIEKMGASVDAVYSHQAQSVHITNTHILADLKTKGLPEAIGTRVLKAKVLNTTLMVLKNAHKLKLSLEQMTVHYLAVAQASRLQEIVDNLDSRPASGRWEPLALGILHTRFSRLLRKLVRRVAPLESLSTVDALVPVLIENELSSFKAEVDEFFDLEENPAVSSLLVLEERLTGLVERMPISPID